MVRKVKVGLEADVAGFIGPVKVATESVDKLGDKVDRLDDQLNKIPPDALKAGAALKLLDGDVQSVGKHVNDLGQNKGSALTTLDAKIRQTRSEVRKLADEFVKTGDQDTFKKLGDAEGLLRSLAKTRKAVTSAIEGGVVDAGKSASLGQVGMAIGAGLAVPILAAVGGAVAAVAGVGIAGLGIAGAVMGDPKHFEFAWGQAARTVKGEFIDATRPFTNDTYEALRGIGPLVASWHLDKIFKDASGYAEPLVHSVESFGTSIVGGIGALVSKGGPAVSALTSGMAELGQAAESALGSIADGAQGGAYALHDTIHAASMLIEVFGQITQAAESAYGFVHDHPIISAIGTGGLSLGITALEKTDGLTKQLGTTELGLEQAALKAGHAFSAQGDDLTALSQKLGTATVSVDTLAASMVNKLFTATMNMDQAVLGVFESLTRLDEVMGKNGKTIDIHTAKGQANREAVLASVTANMSLYQAQIAAGMSAEDAAAIYDDNTAALERQLQKAHLTQGQIDELIGKYRGIPKKVDTDIAIHGLTDAIDRLNETIRLVNGLHDKTITVTVKQVGDNPRGHSRDTGVNQRTGGILRAADGMIVPPSNPGTVLFGEPETGGELYLPLRGITRMRAAGLMNTAGAGYGLSVAPNGGAGGGGGASVSVTIDTAPGGSNLDQAMASWFMGAVRTGQIQITAKSN